MSALINLGWFSSWIVKANLEFKTEITKDSKYEVSQLLLERERERESTREREGKWE